MRRSQHAKTLKGAFTINHQKQNLLIGKPCLLIDDVITTGSTISEAAKKTFEFRCLAGKCTLFCKRALIDNIQLSSRLISFFEGSFPHGPLLAFPHGPII
ncbi:MAG: hypothetical protein VW162_02660 [Alphaproteobacteria bacterium]